VVEAEALCSPDVTHRANPSRQRGRTTGAPFASEMPDIAETISLDHKIEAVLTAAVADCDSTPGVDVAADPRRARNVCSCATTAAPSPIAAPTRFTEPDRTSPIAKIPTTPVSSASRTRSGEGTSAPVWMKPLSSRGMPHPASHVAAGSAPAKTNRCAMACCSSAHVRRLRQRTRCSPWSAVPESSTTSVSQITSTLEQAAMRSIR